MNLYRITKDCFKWVLSEGDVTKGDLVEIIERNPHRILIYMYKNDKSWWINDEKYIEKITFVDLWKTKRNEKS